MATRVDELKRSDSMIEMLLKQQFNILEMMQQQQTEQATLNKRVVEALSAGKPVLDGYKSSIPAFRTFEGQAEYWIYYQKQLEQHFLLHSVQQDEIKKSCLLTWLSADTFRNLSKALGANKLSDLSYTSLIDMLSEQFSEKIHEITPRYKFMSCRMKQGQRYVNWINELRGDATGGNFYKESIINEMDAINDHIRDVIVFYSPHEQVSKTALQQEKLTLEDVIKIATSYEATQRAMNLIYNTSFSKPDTNDEIDAVKTSGSGRWSQKDTKRSRIGRPKCSKCGLNYHSDGKCWVEHMKCYKCNRIGHFARCCRKFEFKVKQLTDENEELLSESEQWERNVHQLQGKFAAYIRIVINGYNIQMEFDTGAVVSVIPEKSWNNIGKPKLMDCMPLITYGGGTVPVLGKCEVDLKYRHVNHKLWVTVSNGKDLQLLGLPRAMKLGLPIPAEIVQVNKIHGYPPIQANIEREINTQFAEVFSEDGGKVKNYKVKIQLVATSVPKVWKARRIPYALQNMVKE